VLAESRAVAAERAQERKDMFVDNREHLARLERIEPRPAKILVRASPLILPLRKDAPLHLDLKLSCLPLLDGMKFIEAFDEQKISNLFNYRERIRYSSPTKNHSKYCRFASVFRRLAFLTPVTT
jgi:hypothetical protein